MRLAPTCGPVLVAKECQRVSVLWRPFSSSSAVVKPTVHARCSLDDSECMEYARGWAWQYLLLNRRLVHRRRQSLEQISDDADTILFLEHSPVYTLGRGSEETHLTFLREERHAKERELLSRKSRGPGSARLAVDITAWFERDILPRSEEDAVAILSQVATPVLCPNGAPIFRVERGGEVTFHGPGQLVVYPLLDLQRDPFRKDLHWFLRKLEESIIMALQNNYGIEGTRDDINSGVWVGNDKIAAIGVSSARWISNHGFAINVSPDLSYFGTSHILPCGIDGRGVTSIAKVLDERGDRNKPSVKDVAKSIIKSMETVFNIAIDHDNHRPLV